MRDVVLLRLRGFAGSLYALIFLALVFYIATIGGLGYISVVIGVLVFVHAVYISYTCFRKGRYLFGCIAVCVALLIVIRIVVPISHEGFGYDENGEKWIKKHEHYIWEFNHIH